MKTETEKRESGAAGKPGETTADRTEQITLNAAGMESLLKSEFAAEPAKPETPPAQEIPAAGETETAEPEPEKAEGSETDVESAEGEAPETEAEQTEEAETKAEGEEAEETPLPENAQAALEAWEEKGGPLPKALQALVDKRIGKLTGARDAEKARADKAETLLSQANAELQSLRSDPKRPAHAAPAGVLDERGLNALAQTAETFVTEAESYLDDTATDEERERVERYMQSQRLDAKALKRRVRETSAWLSQELPRQRQQAAEFRKQETAYEPVAKAMFPWLYDATKPEYAQAQQVLGLMPELTGRTPAHRTAVGAYVLGLKVMDALAKAKHQGDAGKALDEALAKAFPAANGKPASSKPAPKPPPKTPAGDSATIARTPKVKADEAVRTEFNKRPTRESAEKLARAALREA